MCRSPRRCRPSRRTRSSPRWDARSPGARCCSRISITRRVPGRSRTPRPRVDDARSGLRGRGLDRDRRFAGDHLARAGGPTGAFPAKLPQVLVDVLQLRARPAHPDAADAFERGDLPVELLVGRPVGTHVADPVSIWAFWSFAEKSMKTVLISVNSSIATLPASRPPFPVFLTPPNGSWTSAPIVGALMYVIPASRSWIARNARLTSRV